MSATEFAAVASALAWPIVALIVVIAFSNHIHSLLERLTASLSIKSVKLKALGSEVELTVEQAKSTLDELLKAIADTSSELTPEELELFERIYQAEGRLRVEDLIPGFQRQSEQHHQLRRLRDRMLILPVEGGNWRSDRHPAPTRFGKLVQELKQVRGAA